MSSMQLDSKSVVQWWENASDLTKFITLKWSLHKGNKVMKVEDVIKLNVLPNLRKITVSSLDVEVILK